MATNRESKLQILNSSSSGSTPDVGVLEYGELAINIADGKLYYRSSTDELKYIKADVVYSFAGYTGDVAAGVTSHQVLFAATGGGGITGSDDLLFDPDTSILTVGDGGYIDGNIIGAIEKPVKNSSATTSITAGFPVYITGNVGGSDRVLVAPADASDSAKMPAAGVLKDTLAADGEGQIIVTGVFDPYDTTGLTSNNSLYVASGGGLTPTRPSGANDLIQNMARVGRSDSSNGSLLVAGAFRTNDVPNILKIYSHIEMPDGFTTDTIVSSVNGETGDVTVSGATGATGATGAQGPTGATGAIGATGSQGPAGATGATGATGADGATGNDGVDGTSVLSGSGAPSASLGKSGDFYIDTDVYEIYGPAVEIVEGSIYSWGTGTSLIGPTGATGATGADGAGGGGGGTFAASYHGHIESVSNKTYYLDPRLAADRTITEFYAIAGTGGCTAEISGDGSSIGTMQVSTSGSTASLSNTGLSAGNTLELILSDNSLCYDLRFAVRYEQ